MNINVSVIIPTYNRAHLISDTLDSILNQSYQPSEIIVIDDGSTDNTFHAVSKYLDLISYYKIENSGVCVARNLGAEKAGSDWLAFCDSDDIWRRDKLLRQVELIRNAPEIEYCFTNFQIYRRGQYSQRTKFDDAPEGYWDIPRADISPSSFVVTEPFYGSALTFQPIFPSTIMLKKSFFERIGRFDESFTRIMSEDLEFTLRCVQEKPIGVVKEPVVGIRWHEQNFSSGRLPGVSFVIGDMDILDYSMENHRLGQEYRSQIQEQIILRSISAAHGAFGYGEFKTFRDLLKNIPFQRRSLKLWIKTSIALLPKPLAMAARRCFAYLKNPNIGFPKNDVG